MIFRLKIIPFILLGMQISLPAHAVKYAILMGGSGEDFSKDNFFQKDFERTKAALEARGWKVKVLFDGKKYKIPGVESATNANIDKAIEDVQGKLKAGDEVMSMVHAHGMQKTLFGPGHNICTEDPEGYATSKLQAFSNSAANRGVNASLIDLSCYSGNTQRTEIRGEAHKRTKNYCIATLASENYPSICSTRGRQGSFTEAFIRELESKKKLNLETAFLNSRLQDETPNNFPQISSIPQTMKSEWFNFFKYCDPVSYNTDSGFFRREDQEQLQIGKDYPKKECILVDKNISDMKSKLSSLISALDKNKTQSLQKTNQLLQKKMDVLKMEKKNLSQTISKLNVYYGKNIDWKTTLKNTKIDSKILDQIQDLSIADLQGLISVAGSSQYEKVAWLDQSQKQMIRKLAPYSKVIASRIDQLTTWNKDWNQYQSQTDKVAQTSKELMKLERKFYSEYNSVKSIKKDNPCTRLQL